MGMVLKSGAHDTAHVIDGRPDLEGNIKFGVTLASKFPPHVFSIYAGSGLIHKVAFVELHWYRVIANGHKLVKMNRPHAIANTTCGMHFHLTAERARTCRVPKEDAILCGRCHGEVASFGKHGKYRDVPRPIAHVKLGCVVNGYSAVSA